MTPEAVELLLRTKAAVLANPTHFNMDYWYASDFDFDAHEDGEDITIEGGDTVPFTPLIAMLNSCGTVACGAGWIVALSGEKVNPGEYIAHAAARLVGWDDGDRVVMPLFHTSHWPYRLLNAYSGATTDEARAKAFADAVDLWIEVDGDGDRFSAA